MPTPSDPFDEADRICSRITDRRAFPHFNQVTKVSQKPAAAEADLIIKNRRHVAMFGHLGKEGGKFDSGVAGERQRVPHASVDFHEYRRFARLMTKLDHSRAVPVQRAQHGKPCLADFRFWLHALAKRAA